MNASNIEEGTHAYMHDVIYQTLAGVFDHDIKTWKGKWISRGDSPERFIAFECFDIMGKHDMRVFDIASQIH